VVLEVLRDIYFVEKLHNGCDQKSGSFIKDTTIRGLNSCFDKITKSRGKDETKTTTRDDQRVKSALLSLKAFFLSSQVHLLCIVDGQSTTSWKISR
jgi:hypothetical protein